ncbi:MAG: hypothetical protein K8F24_11850 [Bacteroidales bacterium]|nr:hypothetical protein [Bacteroidales bacterium]
MITNIIWNDIPITIEYDPDYSKNYRETYGYGLAHIQLRADRPLPVTQTGYKSQFIAEPLVAEYGDVTAFVTAMLDEAAQSPEWEKIQADYIQPSLF